MRKVVRDRAGVDRWVGTVNGWVLETQWTGTEGLIVWPKAFITWLPLDVKGKNMSGKTAKQKRARVIQDMTGWSYMECLRISNLDLSPLDLELLLKGRGVNIPALTLILDGAARNP